MSVIFKTIATWVLVFLGSLLLPFVSLAAVSGTTYEIPCVDTTLPATTTDHTTTTETTQQNIASNQAQAISGLSLLLLVPKTTTALTKYEPWPKTPTSPHADGFLFGARQAETAQTGQIFSRLGKTSGSYVAPPGTSLSARGLPAGYQGSESLWKVTKPFSMESGLSSPWQGSTGMGIQHKLPQSIDSLWKNGYLAPQ
jgi:hypothetical protein